MSGLLVLVVLLAVCLAALSTMLWRATGERRRVLARLEAASDELQRLQVAFSRFAPDAVVERIIAGDATDIGDRKRVTVLFCDLVGFTALSESVEPSVLVRILNGYFERMSEAITNENGYVSTLIGDGILALFGATAPNPWQENDAVRAALGMRRALADYNRSLEQEGLPRLALGIGIHCGEGVAGLVGSRERREYAFIGQTVSVAVRVQDLTRHLGGDLIVTESVREKLDPQFDLVPMPDTPVKGVSEPLRIHRVEG